jgi:UDP-arabinose 4-epimerase
MASDPLILVTGGAGYVGAHTVHHLMRQGVAPESIVVFDNLSEGHREHVPRGVRLVEGDVTRPDDFDAVFRDHRIERVLHFAGAAYVGESMRDPGKYFRINLSGGVNLLEAMRRGGCSEIVFSSSCTTYGIPTAVPIREDHPQQAISPYGESKLAFEKALRWYAQAHGLRSVALRYFNAAGAGYGIGEAHSPETHLIPLAIQAALGNGPTLGVFGSDYDTPDGTCIRDYVHVVDLAEAHARALAFLQGGATGFTAVNLGTGRGTSVREVIERVGKAAGRPVPVRQEGRRPGDPAALVADPALAASVLGWRARLSIGDIVRDACAWHAASAHG